MKTQKKAQLSFEYILLFAFVMLLFIVIGTVLVSGMEKTRSLESGAQYLAKQIKSSAIVASLSQTDFETSIALPSIIANRKIIVDIYKEPDNLIVIKEEGNTPGTYNLVAREFLPIINSTGGNLENLSGGTILIRKQKGNITIMLLEE